MATTTPTGVRGGHAKHGGHGGHGGGNASGASDGTPMTHRQIMEALTGLLLGMFVAILSSTVVSNALPEIISDLGGGQSAYTWVVTASLLAMTATTPLWGKLADLFSKKLLVQIALVIYVLGSVVAGLSTSSGMLIACRVVQGIGVGGLSALAQIVMAAMIAPRERGSLQRLPGRGLRGRHRRRPSARRRHHRHQLDGLALVLLRRRAVRGHRADRAQKTLKLPVVKRSVKVDWAGAFFISAAVSLLLVWVTFAGDKYDWLSWQTYVMVAGSVLLGLIFVFIESRAKEPIIPLRLFRNRTITLASIASLFVGIAMFAGTVFFSQYFQLARGKSPTMSGVMTIPMIAGLFLSSTISGQVITKTGRWKAWLVTGGFLVTAGLGLLGTIRYDTPYWHVAVFMFVMGLGIGMMMQNLVLATQNQVAPEDLGSASSVVTFFRSLGGAIGVSALGAVLGNRVTQYVKDGLAALGPEGARLGHGGTGGGGIPDLDKLPEPFRVVMESAYGHGVGDVFLYAAPCALIAFIVTIFIKEVALKTSAANDAPTEASDQASDQGSAPAPAAVETAEVPVPATVGAAGPVSEGAAGVTSVDTAEAPQDIVQGTPVHGVVRGAEGARSPAQPSP